MRKRRTIAWAVAVVVLCAVIGVVAAVRHASPAAAGDGVPTGRVRRGDLDLKVMATGELRATHSVSVTAPAIGGGNLKITWLEHTGLAVKKGEPILNFDPSEQQYTLEQSRSELMQAEQEIVKARADATVQTAQDKVDLLKDRYAVRRAELDVQKNELLSPIDAKKNDLALEQARRVLAELEEDIKSHNASGQAKISVAEEKRHKASLSMDTAQQNIGKMHVLAPIDGLVAVEKNTGGFCCFPGQVVHEFREGDQVQPGNGISLVVDPSDIELVVKVGELERGNIKAGQAVDIEFDPLPGSSFRGTVKNVSGVSTWRPFWEANSGGQYDVTIQVSAPDPRLRPGFSAHVAVLGDKQKNVLYVPRQSIFLKDGKRVVYVRSGGGFDSREVKIANENESRASVEGLAEGVEVALADPATVRKSSSSPSTGLTGGTP